VPLVPALCSSAVSLPSKRTSCLLALLTAAALFAAVASAAGGTVRATAAESPAHETSTTLKCEPVEGPVGLPRTCQATVTDIAPDPSTPTGGQIVFAGGEGFRCAVVAVNAVSSTCSARGTPNAPGSYAVEATYFGDVAHFASSGKATLVAGPAGSPPAPTSSLSWSAAGAPSTKLRKAPAKKSRRRLAKFVFSSEQAGVRFECRIDKNLFKPCKSPYKARVGRGRHIFRVRAISADGTYEDHPLEYRWRVLPPRKRR
jgi:hypothetical protein